jgi:hypothetical protein
MLTVSASSSHIDEGVQNRNTTAAANTAALAVATRFRSKPLTVVVSPVPVLSESGVGTSGDRTGGITGCIDRMVAAALRRAP